MKLAHSEIVIDASAENVWNVLTDLAGYSNWNPLITKAKGPLQVGKKIQMRIQPPGLLGRDFAVEILEIVPLKKIRWLGKTMLKGLLDGDHYFIIEPLNDHQSRLLHYEHFSGLFVLFLGGLLATRMKRGFDEMNLALKKHVEKALVS